MADAAQPFAAMLACAKLPAELLQQRRAAADAVQGSLKAWSGKGVARTGHVADRRDGAAGAGVQPRSIQLKG
jgi:hypothetical protein